MIVQNLKLKKFLFYNFKLFQMMSLHVLGLYNYRITVYTSITWITVFTKNAMIAKLFETHFFAYQKWLSTKYVFRCQIQSVYQKCLNSFESLV